MPSCIICKGNYEPFISFGRMPIANGFLTADEFAHEYFFDLEVGFCPDCYMVQLVSQPEREQMFHADYAYFSSISTRMAEHFKDFAGLVIGSYLGNRNSFVVEIGSNDGIMLRHFSGAGIRHLGVDPSANVVRAAREKGIETICAFFDEDVAEKIKAEYGEADAILAANVMCHIRNLHSVISGIKILLKPDGMLLFEDPYLGDIVERTSYDQIYDEHAYYFSLASVENLFSAHELEVTDAIPQNVHGGSMRFCIAHRGAYDISPAVWSLKKKEQGLGLNTGATFDKFRIDVDRSRDSLLRALNDFRKERKRVVGYGATSKSTTVINYCGITPDMIEYISDTTPTKQDKYSPGMHIPIKPYQRFLERYPDVALLFAWNHAEEIIEKERHFAESGGKWLLYVPDVEVIG